MNDNVPQEESSLVHCQVGNTQSKVLHESVPPLALFSMFLMIRMGQYKHLICKLKAAENTSDSRINWDLNHTLHWEKAHEKMQFTKDGGKNHIPHSVEAREIQ